MKKRIVLLAGAMLAMGALAGPANAVNGLGDYNGDGNLEYIALDPTSACGTIVATLPGGAGWVVGSGGEAYGLFTVDGSGTTAEDHFNVAADGPAQVDLDGDGDGDFSCAAEDLYAGFTCGFASTNDPSGQVVQDPNTQTGEVNGGPWGVAGATSVTMSCIISVADGVIDAGDTTVSQTTPGSVGAVASPISYQAAAGQDVYLCTRVTWVNADGTTGVWAGFPTDPDGNPYCDLAISVEA